MSRDPRTWRKQAGLSLEAIARQCGIAGSNPAATYSRYERGLHPCPTHIVSLLFQQSGGEVTAEDWHRLREQHLKSTGRM